MFFYQNPFFLQYPPQMLVYQAYPGPEKIPVFSPSISNQNQPRIGDENVGFRFGLKAEGMEERGQNNLTENLIEKQVKEGCDSDYEP